MNDVVNLNRARKRKRREQRRAHANANAIKYGQSAAQRAEQAKRDAAAQSKLDGAQLERIRPQQEPVEGSAGDASA